MIDTSMNQPVDFEKRVLPLPRRDGLRNAIFARAIVKAREMKGIRSELLVALCLAVEVASVAHARPPTPGQPTPRSGPTDLNLRVSGSDPNNFPLSPRWETDAPQRAIDPKSWCGDPPALCTTVKVTEDKKARVRPLCRETLSSEKLVGHWNWQPAAVTFAIHELNGPSDGLAFEAWNAWPMDDDYDMSMAVPWPAALTEGNKDGVLNLEFEASETIRHFTTAWWRDLRKNVRDAPWQRRRIARTATVIGQLGLDRVHHYATELHPVYALAALVETKMLSNKDVLQHWALFGRNWGSEGECASAAHDLPVDSISLELPGVPGKSVVAVESETCLRTNVPSQPESVVITPVAGKGARVRLPLAEAKRHARVSGELYLRWIGAGKPVAVPATCTTRPLLEAQEDEASFEAYDDEAFVKMLGSTPDTREQTKARLLKASRQDRQQYYAEALEARALTLREEHDVYNLTIRFASVPERERR